MYTEEEMKQVMEQFEECIKKMYFCYMSDTCDAEECDCQNPENLYYSLCLITADILYKTHSIYADHLEGMRKK